MLVHCENAFYLSPHMVDRFAEASMVLEVVASTGSTNTDLKNAIRAGEDFRLPRVRVAYEQTAGRGTRGHQWLQLRDAITFSLALPLPKESETVTLQAGIAWVNAIRRSFAIPIGLKWPNDLFIEGAKVGGILSEVVQHPLQGTMLVVGIGTNLWVPADQSKASWPIRGIFSTHEQARTAPWDSIFLSWIQQLYQALLMPVRKISSVWHSYDVFLGKTVTVDTPQTEWIGIVQGINAQGQLLLKTPHGIVTITTGSIKGVIS